MNKLLAIVFCCSFPAIAHASEDRGLLAALPEDAVLAVEVGDIATAMDAVRRSRLLRPAAAGNEASSDGAESAGAPFRDAASALAFTCDLTFDESVEELLINRLAAGTGPVVFGLVPVGSIGAVPVVIIAGAREGPELSADSGLVARTVERHYVLSTNRGVVDRIAARLKRLPTIGRRPRADLRIRVDVPGLTARRPAAGRPLLSVARHLVGSLPRRIDVVYEAGRETVKLYGVRPSPDRWLAEGATRVDERFDRMRFSYHFSGRISMPGGFASARDALSANPFGVWGSVIRAWPVAAPATVELARHLTGRYRVVALESSSGLVPLVGFELSNVRRAAATLDRLLLGSGVCDREQNGDGVTVYGRRQPARFLRGPLRFLMRRIQIPQRKYRVLRKDDWVWLGPHEEIYELLSSLSSDAPPRLSTPAERDALGRVVIDSGHLWSTMMFEHQELTGVYLSAEELSLLDSPSSAMREAGLLRYRVERFDRGLALVREVPLERSLLPMLAARGVLSHRSVRLLERRVWMQARANLAAVQRAQTRYREKVGTFASSLQVLRDRGLWSKAIKALLPYRLTVGPVTGLGVELIAAPVDPGPCGWRPTLKLHADGRLVVGDE